MVSVLALLYLFDLLRISRRILQILLQPQSRKRIVGIEPTAQDWKSRMLAFNTIPAQDKEVPFSYPLYYFIKRLSASRLYRESNSKLMIDSHMCYLYTIEPYKKGLSLFLWNKPPESIYKYNSFRILTFLALFHLIFFYFPKVVLYVL